MAEKDKRNKYNIGYVRMISLSRDNKAGKGRKNPPRVGFLERTTREGLWRRQSRGQQGQATVPTAASPSPATCSVYFIFWDSPHSLQCKHFSLDSLDWDSLVLRTVLALYGRESPGPVRVWRQGGSDKSRLREHLVFLHTQYTHTRKYHTEESWCTFCPQKTSAGQEGMAMCFPGPTFSRPLEAKIPPGRVWSWILALPIGRAVPRFTGGFSLSTNQSCRQGRGRAFNEQWEHREALLRFCLEN